MFGAGLVLEGGGMRGSYTLGILDVLLENKIYFPYVIGVSAGACNAASYGSRQHGRGQRISETYIPDKRYLSFRNLLGKEHSLYGMDFIFNEIPSSLDPFDYDAFYGTGARTVVGVTDVETGACRYVENPPRTTYNQYLRASSSIPLFSPIVNIDGHKYLDGGTSDPIPYEEALRHCDKVVVILTRDRQYVKNPAPGKLFYRSVLRKYPRIIETCTNRHEIYNNQRKRLLELEQDGHAMVFFPDEMHVDVFEKNPQRLHEIYEQGRRHGLDRLNELREFLKDAEDMLSK